MPTPTGSTRLSRASASWGISRRSPFPPSRSNSLVTLLAWKLTLHGTAADGLLLNEGVWPAIIGHKDTPDAHTSCPGKYLYALLPEIRARVLAAQHLPAAPFTTDVTGDGTADVASIVGGDVVIHSSGFDVAPPGPYQGSSTVAEPTVAYDLVTAGPSLVGGPGSDVLARQATTGFLVRMSDNGTGTLGAPAVVGYAPEAPFIASPGDVTGDGVADLVTGDRAYGVLAVLAGDGAGHLGAPALASRQLGRLAAVAPAGDVDGDGVGDLAVILADTGVLAIVHANGDGTFGAPVAVGSGWDGFDEIAQVGDVSGDGTPDLVVRSSADGRVRTLLGGEGGFSGAYVDWRQRVHEWTAPMGAIGWGHREGATLLALDPATGAIVEPTPIATAAAKAPSSVTLPVPGVVTAAVVGDVDHNGFADVLTRDRDGLLLIHPSTGSGFGPAIVVADPADRPQVEYVPNLSLDVPADLPVVRPYWHQYVPTETGTPTSPPFWSEYASVAPAGDIDFDGTPDLVAVTDAGDVVIVTLDSADLSHPGRGLVIAQGLVGYRVFGVGPWRPGSISDLVAVSPTGDVRVLTGKGMTGALVGGVVASGLGDGDVLQGLGQLEPSGGAAVSVYDATTGETTTVARSDAGDWTPLG